MNTPGDDANFPGISPLPKRARTAAALAGRSVTLIIPPSPFLLDERVFVSLGVLRVAASLEEHGVHVRLLDLSGIANFLDVAASHFSRPRSDDWVGITTTTPQLPSAIKIARVIKELRPELCLVLGGPHVTLVYSAVKIEKKQGAVGRAHRAAQVLEREFDRLVAGDGELACLQLFDPAAAKVIDGDDNKGPLFMSNAQYNESPWPARHLVDMSSYRYTIEGLPATSLISQLGCPFFCGFCGGRNSKSLRVTRKRSIASVVAELEWLHLTYGYTGFMFYDDELNVNKSIVELMTAISRLQDRLGVAFRLRGFVKAELFTEDQAQAMVRAGFRWLLCGFEAANPRILQNIDKRATLADNTRAVAIAKKHGLKVKALMSIGHPGETAATVHDIRDWLIHMNVEDFDCTIITTYPGTPYYDLSTPHPQLAGVWTYTHAETGDRLHSYELDFSETPDYYKGDPNGGYKSYVFTDHLSPEKLVAERDALEREVRAKLGIQFNPARAAIKFEHSMGQGLPASVFRESQALRKAG